MLAWIASLALAHTTPAVLGAAAWDPLIVRLSHGLAIDGAFVCPARWGGPEVPLVAWDGARLWIAADAGVLALDAAGRGVATPTGPTAVRALVAGDGAAFALTSDSVVGFGNRSGVLPVGARYDSLAYDGQLWLARFDAAIELLTLDATGIEVERRRWPVDAVGPWTAQVALLPEPWVRLWGAGSQLWRGGERVFEAPGPLWGPIRAPGSLATWLSDGALYAWDGTKIEVDSSSVAYTCLGAVGPHLCTLGQLWSLAPTPVFNLGQLKPPSLDGLSETEAQLCWAQWLDLAQEARLPSEPVTTEIEAVPTG